jgi:hypothetical protein
MNPSAARTQDALLQAAFVRGRLRLATTSALGALLVVGIFVLLAESFRVAAPLSVLAVVEVFALTYLGGVSGRQALPALLLGVLPLSAALLAGVMGHACTPSGCVSLCAPFCAVGGTLAGLLLCRMTLSSSRPRTAWLSGALLIVTTGSIGCACVGTAGVVGMSTGLLLSSSLWLIRNWIARSFR